MLRFVNICLVLGLVALAYVIYQVKYEARALDEEIATLGRQIDEERDGLAVLRAEWSLLNRPERIERLAQKFLKLAPAQPRQLVTLDKVTNHDFERAGLEAAVAAPTPAVTAQAAKPAGKSPTAVASAVAPVSPADASAPWPQAKLLAPAQASAQ